jgi:hypothetical protein
VKIRLIRAIRVRWFSLRLEIHLISYPAHPSHPVQILQLIDKNLKIGIIGNSQLFS